MIAHNDVRRLSHLNLDARPVLATLRLRIAARVDLLVARWLQRCAANAEAAQHWFETDRKPAGEFGIT